MGSLKECPDLEGIETINPTHLFSFMFQCLEECPDLEGIETLVSVIYEFSFVRLEECPDLEGIETSAPE